MRKFRQAAIFAVVLVCAILLPRYLGLLGDDFAGAEDVEMAFPPCAAPGFAANCVVDGDTIRIGERRIRLTGYDAPEIDGACDAESELARTARAELARWLALGPFQLDGGADPPRDRYGRELRAARRLSPSGDVQLLSDHMIGARLAEGDYWSAGWSDDWGVGRHQWC
ncbi:thermonuclease family protein [Aurantiacibacter gangjinensis]|uniref:thermonuclease family protein n=1 Tax=Aurantiacibacter gangjinensis TaxID=502682 RepID=UPI00069C3332|nr:hypothetical protein [Aurantiacibacter gangjinensis]APE27205.1 nuclease [Aurantiacibacter gangjinensis]